MVSVGDYVTKGMKVAVVVRVDPLRVELTVPEQFVSAMGVGQPVSFEVDAYPGRTFEGKVRFVSPALETSQRALTVEAIVAQSGGALKPGLFASARIEQPAKTPGVLVPSSAVQTTAGTSRVFVVNGNQVEERLVTIGQTVDQLVEITKRSEGRRKSRDDQRRAARRRPEGRQLNRSGRPRRELCGRNEPTTPIPEHPGFLLCNGLLRSASVVRSSRPSSSSR